MTPHLLAKRLALWQQAYEGKGRVELQCARLGQPWYEEAKLVAKYVKMCTETIGPEKEDFLVICSGVTDKCYKCSHSTPHVRNEWCSLPYCSVSDHSVDCVSRK